MSAAAVAKTAGFAPPDAVWIALWDNNATLSGGTLQWPRTVRNKQYTGSATVTLGGFTLNVDKDIVGGPVARWPAGPPELVRVNRRGLISSRHGPTQ